MVRIAPINLYCNPKTLWFDAGDFVLGPEDSVVVTTARGLEFGRMAGEVFEASDEQVEKLKTPLKPVCRIASENDEIQASVMERKSLEALPIFKQMVTEFQADMRPVSVEYLFDGDKAIFYFEAEERVDFRELVRKLASYFRVRIDMRQIGVRDEARMIGGLGHCGQELCCKRLGGEFCPVSIRMAKEQDLSLNSQKISGVCGRLMCCLRYEFDAYKEFKSRAPKQGGQVETPEGAAKVINLDVMHEVVTLKIAGEKPVKVPLSEFEPPVEGLRPRIVGQDAWDSASAEDPMSTASGSSIFATSQLTGQDKLAEPATARRSSGEQQATSDGAPRSQHKDNKKDAQGTSAKSSDTSSGGNRKPRRRRSTKVGGEAEGNQASANKPQQRRQSSNATSQAKGQNASSKKQGNAKRQQPRSQADGANGQSQKKQGSSNNNNAKNTQQAKTGPRPGQKSSGLRQVSRQSNGSTEGISTNASPKKNASNNEGYRRSRRRSHKASGSETSSGASEQPFGSSGKSKGFTR